MLKPWWCACIGTSKIDSLHLWILCLLLVPKDIVNQKCKMSSEGAQTMVVCMYWKLQILTAYIYGFRDVYVILFEVMLK